MPICDVGGRQKIPSGRVGEIMHKLSYIGAKKMSLELARA